ncbi:Hypothetical_protein [Hexamita inflata]|uniref:Hypothetical_protein n=1 Tax=Hexamita inflata TaxID=28002 RepID=A0AA86UW50_9EUKA|nr:Hypothetical protein HINF_LOCUS38733 [Hexamita inflata]
MQEQFLCDKNQLNKSIRNLKQKIHYNTQNNKSNQDLLQDLQQLVNQRQDLINKFEHDQLTEEQLNKKNTQRQKYKQYKAKQSETGQYAQLKYYYNKIAKKEKQIEEEEIVE